MTQQSPPMPYGMTDEPGVIAPQPLPTNVRCDPVVFEGEPAARVSIYSMMGVYTFFLTQEVSGALGADLTEIAKMQPAPTLVQPTAADILSISKVKN